MDRQDLDVVSEFLVMAATLLDIKSRMLLPKQQDDNGEEEDPREELVQKLLEYKMFKYMSYELKDRELDAGRSMYKKPTIPEEVAKYEAPVDLDNLLKDVNIAKLNKIFNSVMQKQIDKIDPVRSKFGKIEKEEVNQTEMMNYIKNYILTHKVFSFRDMLNKQHSKIRLIVLFLAVLELMKTGIITIVQENIFDDILITAKNDINSEDIDLVLTSEG